MERVLNVRLNLSDAISLITAINELRLEVQKLQNFANAPYTRLSQVLADAVRVAIDTEDGEASEELKSLHAFKHVVGNTFGRAFNEVWSDSTLADQVIEKFQELVDLQAAAKGSGRKVPYHRSGGGSPAVQAQLPLPNYLDQAAPHVVVITGPSGSGKTTVEAALSRDLLYRRVISHTSRSPRDGEADGVAYHFVDKAFFNDHSEEFLECVVFKGNFYGVHSSELSHLAEGQTHPVVIVAEPNGATQIQEWCSTNQVLCHVFMLEARPEVLYDRLLNRIGGADRIAYLQSELDFCHESLQLNESWTAVSTERISPSEVAAIIDRHCTERAESLQQVSRLV